MQPSEIAALLHGSQVSIEALLGALPASAARWQPAPGEWSCQEVLGHLIETERRSFASRIQEIVVNTEPRFADWDPDAVGRERNDADKMLSTLLAEFSALRASGIAVAGRLQPGDLTRRGVHPYVGAVSVAELLHEWVFHDFDHLRQIQANLQAFVWPAMGNTQKFYTPPPGL